MKPKFQEHIILAPKPGEAIKRPSPDEPITNLELKLSASLKRALDKLSSGNEENKKTVTKLRLRPRVKMEAI